jgi:hypothetical protein
MRHRQEGRKNCWRRDSNPHGTFAPSDFRTTMAFATLAVCGLDFPLAVGIPRRPQPPSLYTFSTRFRRRFHRRGRERMELGSGLPPPSNVLRVPRLRLNSHGGFPAPVLKFISPMRLPIPPLQHSVYFIVRCAFEQLNPAIQPGVIVEPSLRKPRAPIRRCAPAAVNTPVRCLLRHRWPTP